MPENEKTLSSDMRTYYKDYLRDNANENLVHDQFGQKHPIPAGNGKTIEFRKYSPLPKATKPLAEGVTPNGQERFLPLALPFRSTAAGLVFRI